MRSPIQFIRVRLSLLCCLGVLFAGPVMAQRTPVERSPELNQHFHRAEAAWRSGANMLEAKARVDRVLRDLPEDIQARKLRAQVFLSMKRFEEALVDATYAVRIDPQDAESYLLVAESARALGDRETALEALASAQELAIENVALFTRISWNAAQLGDLQRAEVMARRAVAMEPAEAAAFYQLARVLVQREQGDDAAALLERGLRSSFLDPIAIEKDSVLSRLTDHLLLQAFFR
jgi:tetratricopeptide (TPR) repeat protein